MKKYEYLNLIYSWGDSINISKELNVLGKRGWDVAGFAFEPHSCKYLILLKREIVDSK